MQTGRFPFIGGQGIVHYRAMKIAKAARPRSSESSAPEKRERERVAAARRKAKREQENREHAERTRQSRARENRERYPDFFAMTARSDFRAWWEEATGDKWSEKDEAVPQAAIDRVHEILQWERERQDYERVMAPIRAKASAALDERRRIERIALLEHYRGVLERHGRQGSPGKWRAVMMTLATPAWADKAAIRDVYRRSQEAGAGVVVDHIAPILGETVCGLHVAENLRIIGALENARKSNRWPADGVDADPKTGKLHVS